MEKVTLSAQRRTEAGTRPSRRLRREGLVPAIVYGRGLDPVSVTVNGRELYSALHSEAGSNAVISVEVDGDSYLTVAREVQRHPVRGEITHLDFIKISLDVAIQAEVAIEYDGVPAAIRNEGAVVDTIATSVLIEALPTAVPTSIHVDISQLEIGDTLKIEDLPVIEGVTYVDDGDRPLVTVLHAMAEEETVPAESEAVAADDAEGGNGSDES